MFFSEKVLAKFAHRAREILAFSIDSLQHSRLISPLRCILILHTAPVTPAFFTLKQDKRLFQAIK